PLNYSSPNIEIQEASSCKYLRAAKFAYHRNDSNWETLTPRRQITSICALFKAYTGELGRKATGDRLQRPCHLSRVDHDRKIRSRQQKADIGKYSFVNRTIQLWNQLLVDAVETLSCKSRKFRKRRSEDVG
ncbi:hypothetical protein B7P43_G18909, partial [Cryptotermes secundus]